jgi:hypothetical protein
MKAAKREAPMIDFRKFNLTGEIQALRNSLAEADDHPAIAVAECIVSAGETFLTRLMELRQLNHTDEADDLVASTIDGLADVVGRATRKEEDDRVNGDFYRQIDNWNMRRDAAQ